MQFEMKNNYPFVAFHGFAGFGEHDWISKYVPYFGMFSTSVKKLFGEYGIGFYTPSMSGFTSMWDRACEAYAQIVGGRVDYGKVHSEKYGHERYGETYEAMIPDWGELDAEGKIKKINVIGHSFGGPTVRFFVNMMINGSQEEIDGTPEEELSDFFKGGHGNWIHSCTTLAGANDGISFLYAIEKPAPYIGKAVIGFLDVFGGLPICGIYDPQMYQHGLGAKPSERSFIPKLHLKNVVKYWESDDCVLNDLYIDKFRERSKEWQPQDNIYYFSYYGTRTKKDAKGNYKPVKDMIALLKPTAIIVGKYNGNPADATHAEVGEEWKENDGLVNVMSGRAPRLKKWAPFTSDEDIKPGIWYDMPIEEKDHMSYCGNGESKADYGIFFYEILRRVNNLPSIDL